MTFFRFNPRNEYKNKYFLTNTLFSVFLDVGNKLFNARFSQVLLVWNK